MKIEKFYKEFIPIEDYIYKVAGSTSNNRQNFMNVLQGLKLKKIISNDILRDLNFIGQIRNKVIGTPLIEQEISEEVFLKIARVKKELLI